MTDNIQNYAYLWDGSQIGWTLLVSPELEGGFCIFNIENSTLLHIDDEVLNAELCQRLKEAGCTIIDDPVGQFVGVEAIKSE